MQAVLEPAFWGKLGQLKLEDLKLNEGPLYFEATYRSNNHPQIPGALSIDAQALSTAAPAPPSEEEQGGAAAPRCNIAGSIYCLNTIERMSTFDRQAATDAAGAAIWAAIQDGSALRSPALMQRAVVLAYCDLKQYKYHHWLAFPVLQPPATFTLVDQPVSLAAHFGQDAPCVVAALQEQLGVAPPPPLTLLQAGSAPAVLPLTTWHDVALESGSPPFLVFIDPSNAAEHPGWPLRNALIAAAVHWRTETTTTLRVLCLRTRKGRYDAHASIMLTVALPSFEPGFAPKTLGGWEVSPSKGKPGPRVADLGASMDPRRLAASAVDLNLQLMRWRAAPTLDVGAVARTSCLLLGAGTLGCSVARALLGWGVRKVTFVDNSRVAFSNPVRQSLFTFEDCLDGGRPKAEAAAQAVSRIFPDVDVRGVALTIPMPGHPPPPAEVDGLLRDARVLDELIAAHDVVFLLLDTREARWAPSVMCAAHNTLAITGALGFDSFLVMRHGCPPAPAPSPSAAAPLHDVSQATGKAPLRLGCYFCSDIVAPTNSTVDRTMDQQCTVARPGLSGVCGSLAVELMAAVLQHPEGVAAPAAGAPGTEKDCAEDDDGLPLGPVPHMIRGQFTGFSQTCMTGQAFSQCPACSAAVVGQYRARGAEFILQAVSEPRYLEDLTGLTELHRVAEEMVEAADAKVAVGCSGESDGEGWEEL